jgi:hypothetical protein
MKFAVLVKSKGAFSPHYEEKALFAGLIHNFAAIKPSSHRISIGSVSMLIICRDR